MICSKVEKNGSEQRNYAKSKPIINAISRKTHSASNCVFFSWAFAADLPEWWGKQNENPDDLLQKLKKKWQWTTTNLRGDKNPSPFPLKLTPQLCFFLGIFSCWTALREACPKFSIFSSNCSCVCAVGFALVNWTAHYIYGFQFIIIRALLREAGLFFCVKESCNFAPQKN